MAQADQLNLNLLPPLVESGHTQDFVESGQVISAVFSHTGNSLAVFVSNAQTPSADHKSHFEQEQPVYFVALDAPPSSERRLFISDTLLIFEAFKNLVKSHPKRPPGGDVVAIMRKLGIDYVNFIKECWIHASQPIPRPEPLQYSSDHYRTLYSCFSLFVVLFLPETGYDDAPIGEELMEWLNIHFIEPSTEEGDQLSALDTPWEDENFWPYLTRATLRGLTKAAVFFLNTLLQHPSEELQELTKTLIPLVEGQPRLQNFTTEREFSHAFRRWQEKVKALRISMSRVPEDDRFDDFDNWWDRLSDIVGILEGRGEVLLRVCTELGADWKEACAAWGVFIDPRLRRQDLNDVATKIIYDMPPDPTNVEDLVHASLFSGDADQTLIHAAKLDRWLAAHLADIMAPLALIGEIEDDADLSQRDHYILSYADYLQSDPKLWRITLSYMYSCGDVGRERADEILLRVPLKLHEQRPKTSDATEGGLVGALKQVNEMCFEYKREAVRRTVCKIAAQTFISEKEYGKAVTYYTSAEDWPGLGRVADHILDEYIAHGPSSFAKYASDVSPALQDLLNHKPDLHSVFVHRLMFAVRYSQFHQLRQQQQLQYAATDLVSMFTDDVAPRSWWAIMLNDSMPLLQHESALLFPISGVFELMRKMDEISIRTSQGSGEDYLTIMTKTVRGGSEKEALDRLKTVRLALARYIARSAVSGSEKL
ncbi:Nup85 nucleoporin-domain-containing protein [Mycena floridula]|nr:Nup85 nucleoporin-domain-containing protein [Mycena floridula]